MRVVIRALSVVFLLLVSFPVWVAADRTVHFLAVADWGANTKAQRDVASRMAEYVASRKIPLNAVLLPGDNFYMDLTGINDPHWQKCFEDMYSRPMLNAPFFAVMGNHDYSEGSRGRSNAEIELEYARRNPQSRWKVPSLWYAFSMPKPSPIVKVVMLDSNRKYLSKDKWNRQMQYLERELNNRGGAAWVMVCAHHPLFSDGHYGSDSKMQKQWGTLLKNSRADFYICGHEHDLQHLEIDGWPTSFLLVGGGGAKIRPVKGRRGPYSESAYGFAHLEITQGSVTVRFVRRDGKITHAFTKDTQGKIKYYK